MNKRCIKCGKCCGILVPITLNEMNIIKKYCKTNKIKPVKDILLKEDVPICQFLYSNTCLIYEVRPFICRNFYCNTSYEKLGKIDYKLGYDYLISDIE
jgi:Fe-S-cluster containining protein